MACCTMLYTVQSERMIYRSLNFSKRKSRGLGAHARQLALPGETVSNLGTPNIQLSSSKRADLPFYYLFGQKSFSNQYFLQLFQNFFLSEVKCGLRHTQNCSHFCFFHSFVAKERNLYDCSFFLRQLSQRMR